MDTSFSTALYNLSVEIYQTKTLLSSCTDPQKKKKLKRELKDLQLQAYFYLETLENSEDEFSK